MQQVKRSPRPQYEYYFNRYGKDTLDTVIEWTKLVLPELSDLSVSADPHSGKYLVFVSVGGPERPLRLSLQALSDGTIKWLAFVSMIVVQGGSYSVEEPENFLHPKMQQSLVDLIRMNLEERNSSEYYIISTHSETLINQVTPSELILFSFSDGLTSCKRVRRPEHIEAEINRTRFGLGHYYASNAVS
ncbi:AAA family ATPase [Lichenihabitans sp. Uapishka_5]|uniref:AAA family ATPase n=1 Tax=Lichenihabitans sp. Uapishka_5 TaxID=3037302 RepID=UPI0029E80F4E|nr:AAA family ATPase [Lichenihabitans sp. Uapishka_5]MDX7953960.1 AAA family ATPase [Lichenihabitans sp. Uapishka_5]